MKICLFDHHNNPYPITGYGGIERYIQLLFQKLGQHGVDVTLICVDSSTMVPSYPNQKIVKLSYRKLKKIRWGRIPVARYTDADIFHTQTSSQKNCRFDFTGFKGKWVATCQGDLEQAGTPFLCFVSKHQRDRHVALGLIDRGIVQEIFINYGCVDSDTLGYDETGTHDRIVWLSRICKAKGIGRLVEIAKRIDETIYVAGNIEEEDAFSELKSQKNIEYIGKIKDEKAKKAFFATAKLSLHTSEFNEPFGLTIIEAQQCGVPVAAWANGSLLETNYNKNCVFEDLDGIVNFINEKKYLTFERKQIEKWAKERFSGDNLLEGYLVVYRHAFNHNMGLLPQKHSHSWVKKLQQYFFGS